MPILWQRLRKPPWRTVVPALFLLLVGWISYMIWSPGSAVTDGRHDRLANGLWAGHGWIGGDDWFERHQRDRTRFRSNERLLQLRRLIDEQHIRYLFPHLCPCTDRGSLPSVDYAQLERLLDHSQGIAIYSEWELDAAEREQLQKQFLGKPAGAAALP